MAPPRMKMICTNSPRNYSNPCEFVNAQATNNSMFAKSFISAAHPARFVNAPDDQYVIASRRSASAMGRRTASNESQFLSNQTPGYQNL